MIEGTEKNNKNKKPLARDNVNETTMAEFTKLSNAIDFDGKYSLAISNIDINVA